jgi:hypothetical protein
LIDREAGRLGERGGGERRYERPGVVEDAQ